MFEGTSAALATPFQADGALDAESVRRLCRHLQAGGVRGLFPAGCTGEAATLSLAERLQLIEWVVDAAAASSFVVPGTGSNSTEATIELTRAAQALGVDGAMLITPYYNKPTQAGLIAHYRAVARATDLPLVLYNVPGRTGIHMTPETIATLAEIDTVVAIKEAAGSVDQVSAIRQRTDLTILSGDDTLTLPMMAVGAAGVVSVVANVAPAPVAAMVDAALQGELTGARAWHHQLFPLAEALFCESNPGPTKFALSRLGLVENHLRLPLVPVAAASEQTIEQALAALDLAATEV